MLRIGAIVLGVSDLPRAVHFWAEALGYLISAAEERDDWVVLVPEDGPGTPLVLTLNSSVAQERPRAHVDLFADGAAEQAAEITRLIAIGGVFVGWDRRPGEPDFAVLADTEGNRFCVVDTGGE